VKFFICLERPHPLPFSHVRRVSFLNSDSRKLRGNIPLNIPVIMIFTEAGLIVHPTEASEIRGRGLTAGEKLPNEAATYAKTTQQLKTQ